MEILPFCTARQFATSVCSKQHYSANNVWWRCIIHEPKNWIYLMGITQRWKNITFRMVREQQTVRTSWYVLVCERKREHIPSLQKNHSQTVLSVFRILAYLTINAGYWPYLVVLLYTALNKININSTIPQKYDPETGIDECVITQSTYHTFVNEDLFL